MIVIRFVVEPCSEVTFAMYAPALKSVVFNSNDEPWNDFSKTNSPIKL